MTKCDAIANSPWRPMMDVECQRTEHPDDPWHEFIGWNESVRWTGECEYLKERRRKMRINMERRDAAHAARLAQRSARLRSGKQS